MVILLNIIIIIIIIIIIMVILLILCVLITITMCCYRRRSNRDCEWYSSLIFISLIDPCKMSLPLAIPCGHGTIRVYERPCRNSYEPQIEYRAAFTVAVGKRIWSVWRESITNIVESLLPELKLKQEQRDEVWASLLDLSGTVGPAMSHTLRSNTSSPAVAFFNKFPFEGIVWTKTREADGKVSVQLSRKRHGRPVHSKWHCTREEAVERLREKCISMGREVPVISHKLPVEAGVDVIHQLFGLF